MKKLISENVPLDPKHTKAQVNALNKRRTKIEEDEEK
jgi:hypothetical protein